MRFDIAARLKAERKARKLSQTDLERRSGLPRCRISSLENGRAIPTLETLERISDGLGIPLQQLFSDGKQSAELMVLEGVAANGRDGRSRIGQARFEAKLRKELHRMGEEDQDLVLYIARGLARRAWQCSPAAR